MNRDDIIRMNREQIAQMMQDSAGNSWGVEAHFQRFAALVAATECEACAKVCEEMHPGLSSKRVAEVIRARGETK